MKKFNGVFLALYMLIALCSCSKQIENGAHISEDMLFGIRGIAQTRVDYGSQANGGVSATFEQGDTIGLYAFYNNFYYYYPAYDNCAESVIFENQWLAVDGQRGADYSPRRSWTFSTIYGTAPHTLDCVGYYPYRRGKNSSYVAMNHSDDGAAVLEYTYVNGDKVNADIDFMTAHTRYDDSATPDKFRSDMLALTSIPLSFTRRTASLNFKVTKPEGYAKDIVVEGVTLHFDAYTKFSETFGENARIEWSAMTTGYSLQASVACNKNLEETVWTLAPSVDAEHKVSDLLAMDKCFFLPPSTKILKVVFSIVDGAEAKTYTWHPHVASIEANKHYTLNLELDPARAN